MLMGLCCGCVGHTIDAFGDGCHGLAEREWRASVVDHAGESIADFPFAMGRMTMRRHGANSHE
jgi:hypothetical protein